MGLAFIFVVVHHHPDTTTVNVRYDALVVRSGSDLACHEQAASRTWKAITFIKGTKQGLTTNPITLSSVTKR